MGAAAGSAQVPLGQLADIKIVKGPTAIKSEEGLLTAYVYIDFSGRDVGGLRRRGQAQSGSACGFRKATAWSGAASTSTWCRRTSA